MKALFTKIETLFTRIAHKARRLISNGVLDVINIINRKKFKKKKTILAQRLWQFQYRSYGLCLYRILHNLPPACNLLGQSIVFNNY